MNTQALTIIKTLGGGSAVARLFGIAQPSVVAWQHRGIPHARLQTLHAWARLPSKALLPTAEITPGRIREALEAAEQAAKARAA
jgi:hypothetical protein